MTKQINTKLSIAEINAKIKQEIRLINIEELVEEKTRCQYNTLNPIEVKIKKLGDVLNRLIDEEIKEKIIQNYLINYVIKNNQFDFNNIIKSNIIIGKSNTNVYEYFLEKELVTCLTKNIPYCHILEKYIIQLIADMNQMDLWGKGDYKFTKYVNM